MLFDLQSANAVTVSLHDLQNILRQFSFLQARENVCFLKCVYNEKSGKHLLAAICVEKM